MKPGNLVLWRDVNQNTGNTSAYLSLFVDYAIKDDKKGYIDIRDYDGSEYYIHIDEVIKVYEKTGKIFKLLYL